MRDFTAGHVSTEEAAALLAALQEKVGSDTLRFLPGVSYRNLLVVNAAPFTRDTRTAAPHDLTDQSILDGYPRGPGSSLLAELMSASESVFADHPVNQARRKAGKPPVTQRLALGPRQRAATGALRAALRRSRRDDHRRRSASRAGQTDRLEADRRARRDGLSRYGLCRQGAICRRGLEGARPGVRPRRGPRRGLARRPGGRQDRGPGTDRSAHRRSRVAALQGYPQWRILVSPDHPTPIRTKTHSHGDVPMAIAGSGIQPDGFDRYDDPTAARSSLVFPEGWRAMGYFIGRKQGSRDAVG